MYFPLKLTPGENPVFDFVEHKIERIWAHKTIPNLMLYGDNENIVVKPHRGLIVKFQASPTLYRMVKLGRRFEGPLDEALSLRNIIYWAKLVPSNVEMETLSNRNMFKLYM